MAYYNTSGERDADRYCRAMEDMYAANLPSNSRFREARLDSSPLAVIVIASTGNENLKLIVSETEEPMHNLGENVMQITTKSPVGSEIAKKLHSLKIGMVLESNKATVVEIISTK